jgi:hypothetical protein
MQWGGVAGLAGVVLFLGTIAVVVAMGLPSASDVETLTDFANIESGRIAEHFLYLGALALFALHTFALRRLLEPAHQAASLFGTVLAMFGLVIMAASSMLHISTAPLAELYTATGTTPEDLRAIEYAWSGTQSVFDTMLVTGVLLVPLGMVMFGLAMRHSSAFGPKLGALAIGLGLLGFTGAAIEAIDTTTDYSAAGVLAIVVFVLISSWRMTRLDVSESPDLTER